LVIYVALGGVLAAGDGGWSIRIKSASWR